MGTALARSLIDAGFELVGAYNRGAARAQRFRRSFGVPVERHVIGPNVARAGWVLVTTSDEAVGAAGDLLRASAALGRGVIVAHTSGALPGTALGRIPGAAIGSLHPLGAIPWGSRDSLAGFSYAIEGDTKARRSLKELARALNGKSFTITRSHKARYHAACTIASNLVVALVALAASEAGRANLRQPEIRMLALAARAVAAVQRHGLAAGLTGPIARGDTATVARHLRTLAPETRRIYALLSTEALKLAIAAGSPRQEAAAIRALLAARRCC